MNALVQYWHSRNIPDDVAGLITSFREQNPGLEHRVFDEQAAGELIASRFGGREAAAFRACAVPSVQSDYLRYASLLADGGIYADVDMRCVAPLSPLLETTESGTVFGWPELPDAFRTPAYEWRERIGPFRAIPCNIFAFRVAGHPFLKLALEIATANIEQRLCGNAALATGPGVFTSLYLMRELGSFDAFLDYVEGGGLEPIGPLLCEAVGDFERIERAFTDVRVASMSEVGSQVEPPGPLAYKQTEDHWMNARTSIYR